MADLVTMEDDDLGAILENAAARFKKRILRSGGNASSEAFQEEAKRRAPVYEGEARYVPRRVSKNTGKAYGGYWIRPGQLRDAVYRVYVKEESDRNRAVYAVSWNHYKAPHGWWMENGNSRHPAHPFIRPAWDAAQADAFRAAVERMSQRLTSLQEGGE